MTLLDMSVQYFEKNIDISVKHTKPRTSATILFIYFYYFIFETRMDISVFYFYQLTLVACQR